MEYLGKQVMKMRYHVSQVASHNDTCRFVGESPYENKISPVTKQTLKLQIPADDLFKHETAMNT